MEKISCVYKITNTITGDFYIGSSKDIKRRWRQHKSHSTWKKYPNKKLYHDMQKYGLNNFAFEILAEIEADKLKETEQEFIETLKPTYNQMNAKGLDVEKRKEYNESDKGKESHRKSSKKYNNQLCSYNGETLTLNALAQRFWKQGINHPTLEAKKYLIGGSND